jgi:hypothetical protein
MSSSKVDNETITTMTQKQPTRFVMNMNGGLGHRPSAQKPEQTNGRNRPLTAKERLSVNRALHGSSGGAYNLSGQAVDHDEQLMSFEANPQADSHRPSASKPKPAIQNRKLSASESLFIDRKLHAVGGGRFNCNGQCVDQHDHLVAFEIEAQAQNVTVKLRR